MNAGTANASDGRDTIFISGTASASYVSAGAANDSLYIKGAITNTTAYGGKGNDTLSIDGALSDSSAVFGDLGKDSLEIKGAINNSSVYGNNGASATDDGADSIYISGTASASKISAGAANDTIIITDDLKNSSVYAGAGADTFSGASATSSYLGGNKVLTPSSSRGVSPAPPSTVLALLSPLMTVVTPSQLLVKFLSLSSRAMVATTPLI